MDSDRCAQKADINNDQQRILFNPGGSCIQHVTTKDKPAENSRHDNHGTTGNDGMNDDESPPPAKRVRTVQEMVAGLKATMEMCESANQEVSAGGYAERLEAALRRLENQ